MAAMTSQDRIEAAGEVMRGVALPGLTKPEIRAAVNAIDQWLSDNAASMNAAIPQPARGVLTTEQKARILTFVVTQRYIVGA